jgi:hypothetical protein
MTPLVEAGFIEVNARGHYRSVLDARLQCKPQVAATPADPPVRKTRATIVGDDYFPATHSTRRVVGGDYFPDGD